MKVSEQIAIMKAYEDGKTIEQKRFDRTEWKVLYMLRISRLILLRTNTELPPSQSTDLTRVSMRRSKRRRNMGFGLNVKIKNLYVRFMILVLVYVAICTLMVTTL